MGPLLVLVSSCLEKCNFNYAKFGILSCLHNFLLKSVFFFLFWNHILKLCPFVKSVMFDILFNLYSHQGKDAKNPYASHLRTPTCSTYWPFLASHYFAKVAKSCIVSFKCNSLCWFVFLSFWSNQWITKWWAKLMLECVPHVFGYTVICHLCKS